MEIQNFSLNPGSIVRFRNRDWVILPSNEEEVVLLRPLTGTSDEVVAVHKLLSTIIGYEISTERISPSDFPPPSSKSIADAQSLHLFWQAARLLLREGAAPFRSLGRISIRPRTYQLVPLMMALRLDPVRLLIADDVGVGKTIEAGLIIRELWEQGEIRRLSVLCPPYLCDQWQKELIEKFHLDAVVINSASVGRLERRTPPGQIIYKYFPVQVISIDFVKQHRNKDAFLLHAPELIIVDEAHSATPGSDDRHLRYELVKELAKDKSRHLILLTATPHSGIAEAFQKLLGLLDTRFEEWDFSNLNEEKRKHLALHFVQRTRKDIESYWERSNFFPTRHSEDKVYTLSEDYKKLFDKVYAFSKEIVTSGEKLQIHRRRMRWWSALALLRCVMSSPRAAKAALERRLEEKTWLIDNEDEEEQIDYVYEQDEKLGGDELPTPLLDKTETNLTDNEKQKLRELKKMAENISESNDNKLSSCIEIVKDLLKGGYYPVIWCLYVETANYVAEKLSEQLADKIQNLRVLSITGQMGEEERRQKVKELTNHSGPRVLVATDCLSEGINLQHGFNAVIHYDLPWNPNRLEQREGRVDRFEQPRPVVKAIRFYGKDNPVDGAVIRVLLNKAEQIRKTLGTHVAVPEDRQFLIEALVHALFFGSMQPLLQLSLPLESDLVTKIHNEWENNAQREKISRTRFAQHALKPDEVRKELEATDKVLGDPDAVRNFVLVACQKLGIQVRQNRSHNDIWEIITEKAALNTVPEQVKRVLISDRNGRWLVTFTSPTPEGADYLGRNHPFVTALARYLFEQAFSESTETATARCGAIRTKDVSRLTVLMLLRPRFHIHIQRPNQRSLLAEEVFLTGWEFGNENHYLGPEKALSLLNSVPTANLPPSEKQELMKIALDEASKLLSKDSEDNWLKILLKSRASELEDSHKRIRQSLGKPIRDLKIEPHWPPDLLGILVLQPMVGGDQ